MLVDEGFDVVLANDGRQGLSALLAEPFDAVLLDLYMPVMNGWDLLAEKANSACAHVPVVVFSGQHLVDSPPGAFAVMQKPCKLERLVDVVRAAVQSGARNASSVESVA